MIKATVALDAMGGDFAPKETVSGALLAARTLSATILLVGPENLIKSEIEAFGHSVDDSGLVVFSDRGTEADIDGEKRRRRRPSSSGAFAGAIRIVDAPDLIGMDDKAVSSIRSKPNSSIAVATRLVKDGTAGGVVSAGNTGACASAALLILGRLKGVSRPAIGVPIPAKDHPVLLIDGGANVDCRPDHLLHFGILGTVYSQELLGFESPRVGVLSIGEERGKGNELVQKASALLEQSHLNFIGNVEGRDIPQGNAEVVVTDGFTGNITLKTLEGTAKMMVSLLRDEIMSSWTSKLGALLLKKQFQNFKDRMNPDQHGGAHLLGVNGVCVISHGSSSRLAIVQAIRVAVQAIDKNLINKLSLGIHRELEIIKGLEKDPTAAEQIEEDLRLIHEDQNETERTVAEQPTA